MSLLDFLSPALTVGTEAAGAQQQAQLQSSLMKRQQEIQALLMQRQFHNQDIENTLKEAQTANAQKQYDPTVRHDIAAAEGGGKVEGETPGIVGRAKQMIPVKADEAAAVATAQNPPLEARAKSIAQNTPKYSPFQAVDDTGNPVAVPFNTKTGAFGQPADGVHPLSGTKLGEGMANDFYRQNTKLIDPIVKYASAKNAFAEARAGNPAAVKASLVNFAANADPGMQLRQGVMNYVTRIHPGFVGNFDQAVDALLGDKMSSQNLDYLERLVDNGHNMLKAMYEQRRTEFVKNRGPMADKMVPHADALYDVPGAPSGGPASGGSITVNGKTFKLPD